MRTGCRGRRLGPGARSRACLLPRDRRRGGRRRSTAPQRSGSTWTSSIGDLDSVSPDALERPSGGRRARRAPPSRQGRDRPRAGARRGRRARRGPRRSWSRATAGGSTTCSASLLLLGSRALRGTRARRARRQRARARDPRRARRSAARPGELVTLLALGGPAVGVTTDGLEYPLSDETLEPGSSRGRLQRLRGRGGPRDRRSSGVLLAVRPGAAAEGGSS